MAAEAATMMSNNDDDGAGQPLRPAPPLLDWEKIVAVHPQAGQLSRGRVILTPKQYRGGVEQHEEYIHHGQVSYTDPQTKQMTTVTLLLTHSAWYLFNAKTDARIERNELSQVAHTELDPDTGRPSFKILQRVSEAGISKAKNWLGQKKETEIVTETLKPREFTSASHRACQEWVTVLQHASNTAWQRFFETTYLTSDYEIYQFHVFLTKINRHQRKQIRILAVSTRRILNLAPDVFRPTGQANVKNVMAQLKKVKWEAPLDTLEKIEQDESGDKSGFTIHLSKSATARQKKNHVKHFSLLAPNTEACTFIVESIRLLKERLDASKPGGGKR